jgi:hypothetical protein
MTGVVALTAVAVAVARTGVALPFAAACEDGVVRVFAVGLP